MNARRRWRSWLPLLPCLLLAGGCYTELEGRPRPARDASRRYAAEQTAKEKEEARQRDEERAAAKAKHEADAEAARRGPATKASETTTASATLPHEPRAEGATFVAGGNAKPARPAPTASSVGVEPERSRQKSPSPR